MNNKALLSITTALMLAPLGAQASTWEIDNAHTEIAFKVRHLMVSWTRGNFENFTGTLELNDKDITKSSVQIEVDVASIDTKEEKRDDHLRSPDFFDAKTHPKMTFVSKKVQKKGQNKLAVTGDLTIRGTTKPVTLDVELSPKAVKDPWGMIHRGFTATAKVNRQDFGLKWNKALEAGGVLVGDEVQIQIDAEFVQKVGVEKS